MLSFELVNSVHDSMLSIHRPEIDASWIVITDIQSCESTVRSKL